MSTRLETLQTRLQQYVSCEAAILSGAQEYAIGSRKVTRANLQEISDMIAYLEREIERETSVTSGKGRNRVVGIIPRDF